MTRKVVGPFNRVEGDLDITLDIEAGKVRSAQVNSTLYRGFERMLVGKNAQDALVYAPRICGICSVSQSVATAMALADALEIEPTSNGELARNLILANESLTDLLTHFYLFFMPDFARKYYADQPWFGYVQQRFSAVKGDAAREVLPARAQFLHLMGLLAGKWPHTLSIQPGGTTRPVQRQEQLRIAAILSAFRRFLERTLIGDSLPRFLALSSPVQLADWADEQPWQQSDLRTFLHLSRQLGLAHLGRATDHFFSFGSFPHQGQLFMPRGLWNPQQGYSELNTADIREDVSHGWMKPSEPMHPMQGVTEPVGEKAEAYSWCKAPRMAGQVTEGGALARAVVEGNALLCSMVKTQGGSVEARVVARVRELAQVVIAMQEWVMAIDPTKPFCNHPAINQEGWLARIANGSRIREGAGLIEAARGGLGHWLTLEGEKISRYQIIAPTTWNFSPRDENGQPGPLELALEGTPVMDAESDPVTVQHIVRSFDPCMVCTVH